MYHTVVPYQTPVIAENDSVVFVKYKVTMETEKPCKTTPYFNFSCSYLKNELGDSHFLFLKCNQYTRMKFSAKMFYGANSEPT